MELHTPTGPAMEQQPRTPPMGMQRSSPACALALCSLVAKLQACSLCPHYQDVVWTLHGIVLIMRCAYEGGHNVIGGLLDYLLERHPGSQFIGFKNGPGGILTKSFMDITEEIMVRLSAPSTACLQRIYTQLFSLVSCQQFQHLHERPCNTGSAWTTTNYLTLMTG